ncbi:response regulator [Gilvimarinus agarilyticus]|uniref:hybrid sensor histidine kinase/response regulator transcription factor n=1 Tax=Reichenbachiella agariperforans TaxID=156994 RepID=UPI001C095AD6|nr:ATP-binding protein [Reichenbachiella agariperforans]MBU2884766.1 response regulator [Gilvimarinus agarilyticus]MBU2914912.1 response regulator [Reichenbachiella agariperforans]
MNKLCLLIVFHLPLINLQAQVNEVDSLIYELTQEHHDTTKIMMMYKLSTHEGLGSFSKSKEYALQALQKAKDISFEKGIGVSYYSLGNTYGLSYNLDSAIVYFNMANEIFERINYVKGEGNVLTGLGYAYMDKGDLGKAMEYALLALKKREKNNDLHNIAGSYVQLAIIFHEEYGFGDESIKTNEKKSLRYNLRALKIFKQINSEVNIGIVSTNIGANYSRLDMLDSCLHFYKQALAISTRLGNKYGMAIDNNNMGVVLKDFEEYDRALFYLKNADHLYVELNHPNGRLDPLRTISRIYGTMDQPYEGLKYAKEALKISRELNSAKQLMKSTFLIHSSFAQVDSFRQAYDMLTLYKNMSDSIYDNKRDEQMREQELAYNVEKKEQQIIDLERSNELAQLRRNILIGSLLAIVLIAFLLYNQQRLKSKRNQLLFEKEQEVDRMKSKFFANISHEFRTPLTLLMGPIDHLTEISNDPRQLHFLDMMKRNTSRLLNQVNQLLDLSKLDAGQLKLKVVKIDPVPFIKGIVMSFETLASNQEVNLSFLHNNEISDFYADQDAVEKIVANLLSNALKFTPSKGIIKVEIANIESSELLAKSVAALELIVTDSGIGVDEELQKHIFDRYYHTDSDLQASTGIGLALVKELVDSHFGIIRVDSQKGKGSTFTIHLPTGKNHWKNININESQEQVETMGLSISSERSTKSPLMMEEVKISNNPSILIIENNEDVRYFISEILKNQFQTLVASDGMQGIEKAQDELPDLIITDIMMPGLDGYEVTKQLKSNIKTSHIPVIMLTAKVGLKNKLLGLETEADEYMTKPFSASELIARVNNLISSRTKLREQFREAITMGPNRITVTSIDAEFVNKVKSLIELNMADTNLSVEFLGDQIGMSRSQIYRKLHAITGFSPNQLIRELRLVRAMDLLKNNSGTVSEIAYMVGFNTPNYFNTCFNKKYGTPPGEVKKQHNL